MAGEDRKGQERVREDRRGHERTGEDGRGWERTAADGRRQERSDKQHIRHGSSISYHDTEVGWRGQERTEEGGPERTGAAPTGSENKLEALIGQGRTGDDKRT